MDQGIGFVTRPTVIGGVWHAARKYPGSYDDVGDEEDRKAEPPIAPRRVIHVGKGAFGLRSKKEEGGENKIEGDRPGKGGGRGKLQEKTAPIRGERNRHKGQDGSAYGTAENGAEDTAAGNEEGREKKASKENAKYDHKGHIAKS
jgi:hypothetical protein